MTVRSESKWSCASVQPFDATPVRAFVKHLKVYIPSQLTPVTGYGCDIHSDTRARTYGLATRLTMTNSTNSHLIRRAIVEQQSLDLRL